MVLLDQVVRGFWVLEVERLQRQTLAGRCGLRTFRSQRNDGLTILTLSERERFVWFWIKVNEGSGSFSSWNVIEGFIPIEHSLLPIDCIFRSHHVGRIFWSVPRYWPRYGESNQLGPIKCSRWWGNQTDPVCDKKLKNHYVGSCIEDSNLQPTFQMWLPFLHWI